MIMVFLFHCTRFFGGGPWHLKNPQESIVAHIFIALLDLWLMPLFFLLSGAGSWYALESRTAGQYLMDRVKRILIPLFVIGVFVITVPQVYFEAVTNGGYTGTFWELVPRYVYGAFTSLPDFKNPLFFNVFTGHLWFLQFLFLVSLFVLPIMFYIKSEPGRRLLSKFAGWCGKWGGIFLFLIPITLVRIFFTHLFEGYHSWAYFFFYAVFFLIGYVIPADERFTKGIKKAGWLCLALGIIGIVSEFGIIFVLKYNYLNIHHKGGETFSFMYILFSVLICIASWSWIVFILSLGAKYLNQPGRTLPYCNEAVLPFYILHQTVLLCVGWFVISWDIGMVPKFLIIAVSSFVLIMILYEVLVRHFNVMRFLFGMRPKKKMP